MLLSVCRCAAKHVFMEGASHRMFASATKVRGVENRRHSYESHNYFLQDTSKWRTVIIYVKLNAQMGA